MRHRKGHIGYMVTPLLEVTAAIIVGFMGGAIILEAFGYSAFESLYTMLSHAFNDPIRLVLRASPLILTALAFLIPFRAGLFNIGGEGQVYAGALTAIALSRLGFYVAIPAGVLVGGLVGLLIGVLRVYRGVNEVVVSIMFNWILFYSLMLLISRYLYDPVYTHQSIRVDRMLGLGELLFIVILASLITYIILFHTSHGYWIRISGDSPKTSRYAGVNEKLVMLESMALGGLMGGLGGVIQVYGVTGFIDSTLSALYGLGFLGIGVALIGRLNPLAAIPAALLVSGFIIGGQWLELRFNVAPELADAVIGVIILSLSAPYAYRLIASRIRGSIIG